MIYLLEMISALAGVEEGLQLFDKDKMSQMCRYKKHWAASERL